MADRRDGEKKEENELLEYIYNYLTYSRKLKIDRWTKMLSNADFKDIITKFFSTPSEMILVLQLTPAGVLVPHLKIVESRGKLSYFVKRKAQLVTEINYKDVLIPGDMAPNAIEELAVLVDDAYVPILSNPKNHGGWPDVVRKDVKKQIYNLRSLIWQVKGKIIGQTLLPMPMGIEEIVQNKLNSVADASKRLRLKNNVEEIVIKWATQINEILHEEFSTFSANELARTSELDYWDLRLKNLESLYLQLKDPGVIHMDMFLEETKSPYSEFFKNLIKNVAATLLETRDINLYLKPLESYFQEIDHTEFKLIGAKLKALMHCACLMWANSKYYSMERMIVLLREISDLLISQAIKYINPSTLFEVDTEENRAKIAEVLPFLDNYQDTFRSFKDKIENYFKPPVEPVPWIFHEKLIFERIHMFEKRLKEIESLFDVVQDYLKLERIEMAGLKAKSLLSMVNDIYEEFMKLYHNFGDLPYVVLLPEETQFTQDLEAFFTVVDQFDRRLASIFDQAFTECHNLESLFKLIWIMGSIANRPIIMAQLWHNYEHLIERIDQQFSDIKIMFDDCFKSDQNASSLMVTLYLPPVAAALCLLLKFRKRCRFPVECAHLVDHPLIVAKMTNDLKAKFEELLSLIDEKEREIFAAWAVKMPEICETHLSKTLLNVGEDKLLELNFDPELTTLLREIRYMTIMKKTDLPEQAIEFYNRSQFFFKSTYNLNLIVKWYNRIRSQSIPVEFEIIKEEVDGIDELIDHGQENYNWNSEEVPEYIDKLLTITRKLHSRVFRAQDNLKNIMDALYSWAMMPVLYRKDARDENLLATADKDDRFQERFNEIEETATELERILQENYKLFFDLLPDHFYETDELEYYDEESEGKTDEASPEGDEAESAK
ncbi:dynein beta chain, ciliary-like [Colletes latitarsis]|uniref:dynein beta chain, ciliary-like n=1 Tax=Colletes latitarsis TaxID=2605962 RepID=UPI004035F1F4